MTTGPDREKWRNVLGVATLLVLFVLVSLEVRQAFAGVVLTDSDVSQPEAYAYSLAWLIFGLTVLGVGIWRRHVGM